MTKPTKKGGTWYQRDLLLVIQEKLRRGRCSYHPQFNDGRKKYVTIHNYMEFAFDHVDRTTKHITIAKAIGRWSTSQRLITEMTKCVLTCHNCHTRKGFDSGDFVNVTTIDGQMRLFDAK